MTTNQMPTVGEQVQLSMLIKSEATALQQSQAILPMIADPELRQQVESCVQTSKAHLTALLSYSKQHQLVQ